METHDTEAEVISSEIAYTAQIKGEIDVQISTAKKYPRSIDGFKQKSRSMACLDEATAGQCNYALPRGGKVIEGPSVRFAEIVAGSWGNLRIASRVVGIDDKAVTCQAACHDLETNVAVVIEVKRRITQSNGKRYNDDMINMTANAGCAIAFRNAVFKVVPKAYWKEVYEDTMRVALGSEDTLVQKRNAALKYCEENGASKQQILDKLGIKSFDDIDLEKLRTLRGIVNAIQEGDTTWGQAFAPEPTEETSKLKPGRRSVKKKPEDKPKAFGVTAAMASEAAEIAAAAGWDQGELGKFVHEKFNCEIEDLKSKAQWNELMEALGVTEN